MSKSPTPNSSDIVSGFGRAQGRPVKFALSVRPNSAKGMVAITYTLSLVSTGRVLLLVKFEGSGLEVLPTAERWIHLMPPEYYDTLRNTYQRLVGYALATATETGQE